MDSVGSVNIERIEREVGKAAANLARRREAIWAERLLRLETLRSRKNMSHKDALAYWAFFFEPTLDA